MTTEFFFPIPGDMISWTEDLPLPPETVKRFALVLTVPDRLIRKEPWYQVKLLAADQYFNPAEEDLIFVWSFNPNKTGKHITIIRDGVVLSRSR